MNIEAHVFTPSSCYVFTPSMTRGCEETRRFAEKSNTAMSLRGISIALPDNADNEVIREAMSFLASRIK